VGQTRAVTAGDRAGLPASRPATRSLEGSPADDRRSLESAPVHPAVLAAARRGDPHAYTEILKHYERPLRLLAFRLLGDQQQAEDAMQDAAIRAFRALPRFEGRSALGTWLHRVVYTTCVDHLRKRQRMPEPSPVVGHDVPAPDADPLDRLVAWESLAAALDVLPPDQRVALLLIDQEGYDYHTAGEIIGVPAGTVSSRVSVARATVRRLLSDGQGGGGR
jgi:RNA polymerase sigma-70 factor, ECF subfamily